MVDCAFICIQCLQLVDCVPPYIIPNYSINYDSSIFKHGWTALMWAVVGEAESVKRILSFEDINVNLRDQVCC